MDNIRDTYDLTPRKFYEKLPKYARRAWIETIRSVILDKIPSELRECIDVQVTYKPARADAKLVKELEKISK